MSRRSPVRNTVGTLLAACALVALAALSMPAPAAAQVPLPNPLRFVSMLDLKCYRVDSDAALNEKVTLVHLNRVVRALGAPDETVVARRLQQLCVPVAKNQFFPGHDTFLFVQNADFACYGLDPVFQFNQIKLRLSHLNPVFQEAGAPDEVVVLGQPRQLCVPVAKNHSDPPPEVRLLIEQIDLKCYDFAIPPTTVLPLNLDLRLSHLNPVLIGLGMEDERVTVREAQQLCLPVAKNNNMPRPEVLEIVRWIDILKYRIDADPLPAPVPLVIRHLNPLFQRRQPESIRLVAPTELGVPVAKNNAIPPAPAAVAVPVP